MEAGYRGGARLGGDMDDTCDDAKQAKSDGIQQLLSRRINKGTFRSLYQMNNLCSCHRATVERVAEGLPQHMINPVPGAPFDACPLERQRVSQKKEHPTCANYTTRT